MKSSLQLNATELAAIAHAKKKRFPRFADSKQ